MKKIVKILESIIKRYYKIESENKKERKAENFTNLKKLTEDEAKKMIRKLNTRKNKANVNLRLNALISSILILLQFINIVLFPLDLTPILILMLSGFFVFKNYVVILDTKNKIEYIKENSCKQKELKQTPKTNTKSMVMEQNNKARKPLIPNNLETCKKPLVLTRKNPNIK